MTEASCVFCGIVEGEIPANRVYEDNVVLAFLDIHPINIGHTLVIPKKHHAYIYDVPDDEIGHLYKIVKKIAIAIKKALKAEGITISQNNECAAGQRIFHVHVHIIPRYEKQPQKFKELKEVSKTNLNEVATILKQYL